MYDASMDTLWRRSLSSGPRSSSRLNGLVTPPVLRPVDMFDLVFDNVYEMPARAVAEPRQSTRVSSPSYLMKPPLPTRVMLPSRRSRRENVPLAFWTQLMSGPMLGSSVSVC